MERKQKIAEKRPNESPSALPKSKFNMEGKTIFLHSELFGSIVAVIILLHLCYYTFNINAMCYL